MTINWIVYIIRNLDVDVGMERIGGKLHPPHRAQNTFRV
ncbi:MAG: hypothetical protein [Olavius algarvensis Delta 4 endosymbiont]|nr:MAG: hypothetical protein [Olavius algarvensis Delta 4 endosymbiont]